MYIGDPIDPNATMPTGHLLRSLRWFAQAYARDGAQDNGCSVAESARIMAADPASVARSLYVYLGRNCSQGELHEVLTEAECEGDR